MTVSTHLQLSKKLQPSKAASRVKTAVQSRPSGLSREEIRQIVIEMIG